VEAAMRDVLGSALWGTDEDALQDAVMGRLAARSLTLAIAEDPVTGGAIAGALTLVTSGLRHQVWRGAEVARSTPDASAEAARSRSQAARVRAGADVGIGVAVDEQTQTVHVVVGDATGEEATSFTFPQALAAQRARTATAAMALLRRRYCT
jgi:nicotinamide mononucleotide (NMN) deamidase PncC